MNSRVRTIALASILALGSAMYAESEHSALADSASSMVKAEVTDPRAQREAPVRAGSDGVIRLVPLAAKLQGKTLQVVDRAGRETISKWDNPDESVTWDVEVDRGGTYVIQLVASAPKVGAVIRVTGLGQFACSVPETEDPKSLKTTRVGEVVLKAGQKFTLRLLPVADGWQPVSLDAVELLPQR